MKGIIKTTKGRVREAERENERLAAENARLRADLEYVAMMSDVDIEQEEDETDESDV